MQIIPIGSAVVNRSLKFLPQMVLPRTVKPLIRPALGLSIGLHALLVLWPLPSREPIAEAPEETAVDLTQLPPRPVRPPSPSPKAMAVSPAKPSDPKPSPKASPAIVPSTQPAAAQIDRPTIDRPTPVVPPSAQVASVPAPASSPAPIPSPSPLPPSPPAVSLNVPFADFPHLQGAESGCFGASSCRQVQGSHFRMTAQTIRDQMEAQGYQVSLRDDLAETGQTIYELSKEGQTRYLSVLSTELDQTAYILAAQPVTIADLQIVGQVQSNLQSILEQKSGGNRAIAAQFLHPDAFFTESNPRPEIGDAFHLVAVTDPNQFSARLLNDLQASGFAAAPVGEYGGGLMYEVSQGAFTGYLNLVPTRQGSGTIVVWWTSLPEANG